MTTLVPGCGVTLINTARQTTSARGIECCPASPPVNPALFDGLRQEAGHGSAASDPTFVLPAPGAPGTSATNPLFVAGTEGALVKFHYEVDETLLIPKNQIVYFDEVVSIDGVMIVDGIYKETEFS